MNKLLKGALSIALLVAFLLLFLLPIYAKSMKKHSKKKQLTIAFSIDDLRIKRWTKDRDYFEAAVKKQGNKVLVTAANASASQQVSQIQNFISRGVDAIVIVPFNGNALTPVIKDAKKAGIKVIAYDRLILNANVDAYISFDNEKIGEMQANELIKVKPKGNYFLLGGSTLDHNAYTLRAGQEKALAPYVKSGAIKIVGKEWTKDWMTTEAFKIIEHVLIKNDNKIDAIVASNDGIAGGAIQALHAQKLTNVAVSGQDTNLTAVIRVAKGTQTMTVYKPLRKVASRAAKLAMDLVKGNKIHYTTTLDNKYKKVNTILLKPITITKANINILIKDKVYTKKQLGIK